MLVNRILYETKKKFELKTCLVDIKDLLPHEEIVRERVEFLKKFIMHSGYIKFPILVDINSLIILDGHHRVAALSELNLERVPAFFVDYRKDYVVVKSFRKEFNVTKSLVIMSALSGKLLPPKTSRHILKNVSLPASFVPLYSLSRTDFASCLPVFQIS